MFINYHKQYDTLEFGKKRIIYIGTRLLIFYLVVKYFISFLIAFFLPGCKEFYQANELYPFSGEVSEIVMILLLFIIYEVMYFFNKSKAIEIEKNKLQKVTAEQKLNTLKNQVNPHFLFNSLNTLVTIIPEDKNQAIKFVHELSKTYRTILEVRDEKLITIKKEMEALHCLLYTSPSPRDQRGSRMPSSA